MIDGPQTELHKYQLPTVIEPSSGITLEVRGLTNQTCMSAGHISAGDQNCNHVSFKDNARQYGWLTARFPRLPVNALGVVQWRKLFGLSGMTREELSHRPAKPLLTRFLNGEGTDVSSVSRPVSCATANGHWTKAEAITTTVSTLRDCGS